MDRQTAIDRLAAVPLDEFVAERKRLAKELRGAGDREAAADVAKLPKPTPPAWALNHLAREEPETVESWLEAAGELRDASTRAGEVGGAAVRAAMTAHREATRTLVAAVRERQPLSEPMLDRVRALLQSATVDPEAAERLRSGLVVEGADGDPALPGPASATERAAPAPASRRKAPKDDHDDAAVLRAEREAAEARAELERRAGAASAELERRRELAAEAEAAADAAAERLEEARRTLHRSESELSAARSAAGDARAAVKDAEREVRVLIAQLRGAS